MTAPAIAQRKASYTPADLAELHNVTESVVRRRCREGTIPFFRLGKLYRFTPDDAHSSEMLRVLMSSNDDNLTQPVYVRTVYFIGSECGPIKIGIATDVAKRLADLQAASPSRLFLMATTTGGSKTEKAYHRRFASAHSHGEWFDPHPEILAEIERLTA